MASAQYNNRQVKAVVCLVRYMPCTPDELYNAWINEEEMAAWWGPYGFSNPVCTLDPRPYGAILIHMTAPDGMVFPMTGFFRELYRPSRIVFTSAAFEAADGHMQLEAVNTVSISVAGGRTRLTLRTAVLKWSRAVRNAMEELEESWNQSLDRLEDYLRLQAQTRQLPNR